MEMYAFLVKAACFDRPGLAIIWVNLEITLHKIQ